jgi:hypothetical protein
MTHHPNSGPNGDGFMVALLFFLVAVAVFITVFSLVNGINHG